MEIVLFILFIISCVYCCDTPAWEGFEFLINDHNSILYSIGISIIASYVFYLFQVVIPRIMRFRRTRSIAFDRLYKIEKAMHKTLCCLQGELPPTDVKFSTESIKRHLGTINVFSESSKHEIQQHKELSVFEALVHYDKKTMSLADEIIAGQYLESKYENRLISVKKSSLHNKIMFWLDNLPGEYTRPNQMALGYYAVDVRSVNSDIVSSLDEYIKIYELIKKTNKKLHKKLNGPFNEIIKKFSHT